MRNRKNNNVDKKDLPHVLYIRVSTEDKQTLSIDSQYEMLKNYCVQHNINYDKSNVIVDKVSGKKKFYNRPGGQVINKLIEENKIAGVVALRIDRLSRNTIDFLTVLQDFDRNRVTLHLIDFMGECVNTEDPATKLSLTIFVSMAEYERGMISKRVKDVNNNKRKNNKITSAHAPYGYKKKRGVLVKDEYEQHVIQRMLYYKNQLGLSYDKVANKLIEEKLYNRNNNPFDRGGVYRILSGNNSKYYGLGKEKDQKSVDNKKSL